MHEQRRERSSPGFFGTSWDGEGGFGRRIGGGPLRPLGAWGHDDGYHNLANVAICTERPKLRDRKDRDSPDTGPLFFKPPHWSFACVLSHKLKMRTIIHFHAFRYIGKSSVTLLKTIYTNENQSTH